MNLGDSYAGSNGNGYKQTKYRNNNMGQGTENFSLRRATDRAEGVPPKNLLMVPARFALAMQADGWILRSEMVWAKPNPMPESVTDRPTKAHEMIYLFSKQERYFWDQEAVREPHKEVSLKRIERAWSPDHPADIGVGIRPLDTERMGERFCHPNGRNMRTVLTVATQPYSQAHFAVWPVALVEPMIKAGSRAGDTVLDPFSGSGTTGRVAVALGRRYIGIDLAAEYLDTLAPERLTVQMEMI